MALRYAILGYLSSAPGSGYDLATQLGQGLGWFWSASHSQIYPALKRLEEDGLVSSESTTVGEKLEKRIYAITDEGLEALTEWAAAPPMYRPNRDPERLQLIFSDLGDTETIKLHLEAHRDLYRDRAAQLRNTRDQIVERKNRRVEERMANKPEARKQLTLLLRDIAYAGDIGRAEHEVEWAEEALERLATYASEFTPVTTS